MTFSTLAVLTATQVTSQASSTLCSSNEGINECCIKASYCSTVLTASEKRDNEHMERKSTCEKKECYFIMNSFSSADELGCTNGEMNVGLMQHCSVVVDKETNM